MTNMRQDNDMINRLGPLYVKKKMNCHKRFDRARYMMKTIHNNDMIDHTSPLCVNNEIELL